MFDELCSGVTFELCEVPEFEIYSTSIWHISQLFFFSLLLLKYYNSVAEQPKSMDGL